MFEAVASSWPLDLSADEVRTKGMSLHSNSSFRELAIAARLNVDPLRLQSSLLAKYAKGDENQEECESLYCWVAFNQLDSRAFDKALISLRNKNPSRLEIRILTILGWLWRNDLRLIATAPSELWSGEEKSPLLKLCKANYCLKVGNLAEVEKLLSELPNLMCPEMVMLQGSLLSKKGETQVAIELLLHTIVALAIFDTIASSWLTIEGKMQKCNGLCSLCLVRIWRRLELLYHLRL